MTEQMIVPAVPTYNWYKAGFWCMVVFVGTAFLVSMGFVVGIIFARPQLNIQHYEGSDMMASLPATGAAGGPIEVPEIRVPKRHRG